MNSTIFPADQNSEHRLLTNEYMLAVKRRSDRLMNYFLPGFFLAGIGFAFFYDTWQVAVGIGALSLIAYYSVKWALPESYLF